MLNASALSEDPVANLKLALGVELAVLPPYLYALWSIKSDAEGASQAATEAAFAIRTVVYEEMLHAGLVANLLNALDCRPDVTAHLMRYPGPLPGHTAEPPWGYDVGLLPLSTDAVTTFMQIERPEWDPPAGTGNGGWITIGEFYDTIRLQLEKLPEGRFSGGRQVPRGDNPGPGEMIAVADLQSALRAIETVVDQGEGHRPKSSPTPRDESDDDHEVAHYYQFQTLSKYFEQDRIHADRDLHPVIGNPDASKYSREQQTANNAFNATYTALLDSLQAALGSHEPRVFGEPSSLMLELGHLTAVLRNAGTVPGTEYVAGPTFEYLRPASGASI